MGFLVEIRTGKLSASRSTNPLAASTSYCFLVMKGSVRTLSLVVVIKNDPLFDRSGVPDAVRVGPAAAAVLWHAGRMGPHWESERRHFWGV